MRSLIKKPKVLYWTQHSRVKMRHYGFSEARVRRVMHAPERIEEGIAENTVAFMQPMGNGKQEIWVMAVDDKKKNVRRVISAWRYPGRTKLGKALPAEVVRELRSSMLGASWR